MSYPIPHHLRKILIPAKEQPSENGIGGTIRCHCGSDKLHLLYVANRIELNGKPFLQVTQVDDNFFLRLGAKCPSCAKVHLLFDDKLHGWNGYVCESKEMKDLPRPPYLEWLCHACKSLDHKIDLVIQGEDKESALGEGEGILTEEDWFEGFGWLTVSVTCSSCACRPTEVVSYETM